MAPVEVVRDADERAIADFDALVNMGPATLERWLDTVESRAAGQWENGKANPSATFAGATS